MNTHRFLTRAAVVLPAVATIVTLGSPTALAAHRDGALECQPIGSFIIDIEDIETGSGSGSYVGDTFSFDYSYSKADPGNFEVNATMTSGALAFRSVLLIVDDGDGGEYSDGISVAPGSTSLAVEFELELELSTSEYDEISFQLSSCDTPSETTETPTTVTPTTGLANAGPSLPKTGTSDDAAMLAMVTLLGGCGLLAISGLRRRNHHTA